MYVHYLVGSLFFTIFLPLRDLTKDCQNLAFFDAVSFRPIISKWFLNMVVYDNVSRSSTATKQNDSIYIYIYTQNKLKNKSNTFGAFSFETLTQQLFKWVYLSKQVLRNKIVQESCNSLILEIRPRRWKNICFVTFRMGPAILHIYLRFSGAFSFSVTLWVTLLEILSRL